MNPVLVLALALSVLQNGVTPFTHVQFWRDPQYAGTRTNFPDVDTSDYMSFSETSKCQASSFKIVSGSCIEYYDQNPPNPSGLWGWSTQLDYGDLSNGSQMNDKIETVKSCGNYTTTLLCPTGTFVKRVKWDSESMLRNGIEIHCFLPSNSDTAQAVIRSHGGSAELKGVKDCSGAVRAVDIWNDRRRRGIVQMHPLCAGEYEADDTTSQKPKQDEGLYCMQRHALSGFDLVIENRSGFIKDLDWHCEFIGDIVETTEDAQVPKNLNTNQEHVDDGTLANQEEEEGKDNYYDNPPDSSETNSQPNGIGGYIQQYKQPTESERHALL